MWADSSVASKAASSAGTTAAQTVVSMAGLWAVWKDGAKAAMWVEQLAEKTAARKVVAMVVRAVVETAAVKAGSWAGW